MKLFILATIFLSFSFPALALAEADNDSPENSTPASSSVALEKIKNDEEKNLYRYRDIYLITGKHDSKAQLSFKLRLLENTELYFGYSQLMFWKLFNSKSSPFRDVTYNPELFYSFKNFEGYWRLLTVGIEHRSNGRDKVDSRSFDRVFAQIDKNFSFGDSEFNWSLRLFAFYNLDKTNRDIRDYLGFWETRVALTNLFEKYLPIKTELYVGFYPGSDYGKGFFNGGNEVGLMFRARMFGLFPHLMLQYYSGKSESLIDYDKATHSFRAGFLL